jgi:signal peptidase I
MSGGPIDPENPAGAPQAARILRPLLLVLVAVALAVTLATRFLAMPWTVAGGSMEPTLSSGDRVWIDVWTLRHRPPRVGEIVLLDGPGGQALVKRVARPPAGVGPGSVWVLGDAPAVSRDSRQFGAVPSTAVRGRVAWRFWPARKAGPVR